MPLFRERAVDMGLESDVRRGMYSHRDRYGEVVYREVCTMNIDEDTHPTDDIRLPMIGVFTKRNDAEEYNYCGYVSNSYQFIGNEPLVNRVQESIREVGSPEIRENIIQDYSLTRLRSENIIQNSQNVPQVGDVLPVIIVENSYNGTRAAVSSFGIATQERNNYLVFAFKLGTMRQVHLESSATRMSTFISQYMQVFNENISELINNSFQSRLTEDDMLRLLDLIESFGKKRREKISELLQEINPPTAEDRPAPLPTAWQMFLAIVRYSSFEPNLNIKRLLENAAESVLVIPQRMHTVLDRMQNNRQD